MPLREKCASINKSHGWYRVLGSIWNVSSHPGNASNARRGRVNCSRCPPKTLGAKLLQGHCKAKITCYNAPDILVSKGTEIPRTTRQQTIAAGIPHSFAFVQAVCSSLPLSRLPACLAYFLPPTPPRATGHKASNTLNSPSWLRGQRPSGARPRKARHFTNSVSGAGKNTQSRSARRVGQG